MKAVINTSGKVTAVYDEEVDLSALGPVKISRASTVEPDSAGRWWADLALSNGPKLGPYTHRSHALVAERQWLEDHLDELEVSV